MESCATALSYFQLKKNLPWLDVLTLIPHIWYVVFSVCNLGFSRRIIYSDKWEWWFYFPSVYTMSCFFSTGFARTWEHCGVDQWEWIYCSFFSVHASHVTLLCITVEGPPLDTVYYLKNVSFGSFLWVYTRLGVKHYQIL